MRVMTLVNLVSSYILYYPDIVTLSQPYVHIWKGCGHKKYVDPPLDMDLVYLLFFKQKLWK